MACAEPFLEQSIHPTVVIQGYRLALEDIIVWCREKFSKPVDVNNAKELNAIVHSCLGKPNASKFAF